jgi:hypothetical protein
MTHADNELGPEKREARILAYIAGGRNFKEGLQTGFMAYQGFLPLEPFLQLQEAFGWALWETLAVEYRGLSPAEAPITDEEKLQQWMRRTSLAAGVNLIPFYTDWGFPLDDPTLLEELNALPDWDANPMDQYDN